MPPQTPPRIKLFLFSVITTLFLLTALNIAVESLETSGIFSTWNQDDLLLYNENAIAGLSEPGLALPTNNPQNAPKRPEDIDAKNGWYFMTFGGSFALGTPYSRVETEAHLPGGITRFIEADLKTRFPNQTMTLFNLAAGSIPSGVVDRLVRQYMEHKPDVVFVATCNNEGNLDPSDVAKALNQLGGYRLLKRLLKAEVKNADRPIHTAQKIHPEAIRTQFRANLTHIAEATQAEGIPLLLATLPVNLRYAGDEKGHLINSDGTVHHGGPNIKEDACIVQGKNLFSHGQYEGAIRHLKGCEDVAEALRWEGLSLIELNQIEEAKRALNLSIELNPRNRCRPSLNTLIREIAASYPHIVLVDLEKRAIEISPDGLPGKNLFLDYCHMHWRGYYEMAQVVLESLDQLDPFTTQTKTSSPSMEALRQQFGLQQISEMGDITRPSSPDTRSPELETLNWPEPGVQPEPLP